VVTYEIKEESGFSYIETKPESTDAPLVLLHGLMGALSNFEFILDYFKDKRNVVVPMLPIFEMPLKTVGVDGLVDYIEKFVNFKSYGSIVLLGNSLGGHICQMVALRNPQIVKGLVLAGSSGLYENAMGSSFPKRGNYEYIKQKTEMVFYDPKDATKDLIDEVFEIINDLGKCIRIVKAAKSAVRHNLEKDLPSLKVRTLLIWGREDEVTPCWVGEKFHELLPSSELHIFEQCGHVPMMEHPKQFNLILEEYLERVVDIKG
jgi:pimeloyl-ACP methyl ester carboxylesterase